MAGRISVTVQAGSPDGAPGEWDRFVASQSEGSPFVSTAWADVLRGAYGLEATYLSALEDGVLVGVLPVYYFSNLLFGARLMTAPFSSWGGVCASSREAAGALIERAVELGRSLGAGYFELRGLEPSGSSEFQSSRTRWVDFVLPIAEPEHMWQKTLAGRARTAVRKARKSDVEIRRGHELIDPFFEIMSISMRRLGTPVHSKAFFGGILRSLGEDAELLLAYVAGEPIAAYLLIRDARRMFHWTGGSKPGFERTNANSLLMWTTLELAHESGVSALDLGRSSADAGTVRFKEQWGAQRIDLHYEYALYGSTELPNVAPTNPRYRAAIEIWKRLPLAVTRWIGPRLMRGIP